MNIEELRAFVLCAERGSVTMAARETGITQPGLSRQLQKLERWLGVPLFMRVRSGVRLTPEGELYRAYAHDVLTRYARLHADLQAVRERTAYDLRIAASVTPAEFLLPALIAEFARCYSHGQPRVTTLTLDSASVVNELCEGRWHLGFVAQLLRRPEVEFHMVAEDEVLVLVSSAHPFARYAEILLEALRGQPTIDRDDGWGPLASARRALAERGACMPPLRVVRTLPTTQALMACVARGEGIAFVSSLALAGASPRQVVGIRLAQHPLRRRLYLVRHRRRIPTPAERRFSGLALRFSGSIPPGCRAVSDAQAVPRPGFPLVRSTGEQGLSE